MHLSAGTAIQDPRQTTSHVTFLQQLNEADGPMLLAGCRDGTVRVYRNYTLPGLFGCWLADARLLAQELFGCCFEALVNFWHIRVCVVQTLTF